MVAFWVFVLCQLSRLLLTDFMVHEEGIVIKRDNAGLTHLFNLMH